MTITLTVAGRIATVDATTHVVAGNTYPVTVALDSEWTGNLYLRVRFGSLYYDIPFASSAASVDVQMPVGYPEVGIGVYSEALEICTSEARVRLLRSILEAGEQVVEFDSDLYDQWAGEVTTLLTDDAFDAESTRPVQNAVLTAWKNTVPLDANLVHKTGNETIGGVKTFSDNPSIQRATPVLTLKTTATEADTGNKGFVEFVNANRQRGTLFMYREASAEAIGMRVKGLDGSGNNDLIVRAMSDGTAKAMCPSFTADNNADTTVVTRAMLASTPTVVHTSGIETIAGAKTFTSLLTASNVQVKDASTPTVTMLKGSTEVASLASDGTQAGITASSQFFGLRGLGTAPFGQAPSYTADNSADAKIVTRAMLASSPTVVHTTGNETVAGAKWGDWRGYKLDSPAPTTAGKWLRYAELTSGYIGFVIEMFASRANNGLAYGLAMIGGGGGPFQRSASAFNAYPPSFAETVVAVINQTTGHIEIWIYVNNVDNVKQIDFYTRFGNHTTRFLYPQTEHDSISHETDTYGGQVVILGHMPN